MDEQRGRAPIGRRAAAWGIDVLLAAAWAGVLAAVGVPLYLAGVTDSLDVVAVNVLGALLLVAPVAVAFAILEGGRRRATIGKRAMRIVVTGPTGRMTVGRALGRNVLKIALPWLIAHVAVLELAGGREGALTWIALALAYALPIAYAVGAVVGSRRTLYDRVSGTTVRPAAP